MIVRRKLHPFTEDLIILYTEISEENSVQENNFFSFFFYKNA